MVSTIPDVLPTRTTSPAWEGAFDVLELPRHTTGFSSFCAQAQVVPTARVTVELVLTLSDCSTPRLLPHSFPQLALLTRM